MSNPLLRNFVEKVTEKSFDKGLFWGVVSGVFGTNLFYKDKMYKLEKLYQEKLQKLERIKLY